MIIDEKADSITLLAVIEHINCVDKLIKNIDICIKPNGVVILTTPTKIAKPILEFMAFKLKIINEDEIREHVHYYNEKELEKIFEENNFSKIESKKFLFGMNQVAVFKKKV